MEMTIRGERRTRKPPFRSALQMTLFNHAERLSNIN